LRFNTYVV